MKSRLKSIFRFSLSTAIALMLAESLILLANLAPEVRSWGDEHVRHSEKTYGWPIKFYYVNDLDIGTGVTIISKEEYGWCTGIYATWGVKGKEASGGAIFSHFPNKFLYGPLVRNVILAVLIGLFLVFILERAHRWLRWLHKLVAFLYRLISQLWRIDRSPNSIRDSLFDALADESPDVRAKAIWQLRLLPELSKAEELKVQQAEAKLLDSSLRYVAVGPEERSAYCGPATREKEKQNPP